MGLLNINTEIETTGKWSDQLYKDYVIEKFEKSQGGDDSDEEDENQPSELEKDIEVNFYPPYMNGCAGHIISKNIAEYIVENINSPKTQEYTNEDASLGIWLYNAPFVRHINYVNFLRGGKCDGHCKMRNRYLVGHKIGPKTQTSCNKNARGYMSFFRKLYFDSFK